jgi:two-component system response regulator YesN
MNILIADDERIVRLTLISMLRDLNLNIEELTEVDNGSRMLEVLRESTPDIAFVDIKMPNLNGLEAIKSAREISPSTQWVILTGFPEFEFAKQAIELGVSKYLLKPVSPEALHDTIPTLLKNSSANYHDLNQKFERDIISLYHNYGLINEMNLENMTTKSNLDTAILYFDGNEDSEAVVNQMKRFFAELSQFIDDMLSNYIRIALFNIAVSEMAPVFAYNSIKSSTVRSASNSYFGKVTELAAKYSGNGLNITVLRSSDSVSYHSLNENFALINKLAPLRVMLGTGCMHSVAILTALEDNGNSLLEFSRLLVELVIYYNQRKYLFFNNTLKRLGNMLSQPNFSIPKAMKKNIGSFLTCTIKFGLPLEDHADLWLNALNKHGEALLLGFEHNSDGYIEQVIDFIKENYNYDIGINTIANSLNITPNYLSALFHKKTNRKFIDYLTEFRILKAKELLMNTRLSIEKIAEKVGYHSTRHFTKLFLKYTKQYPSEYRKNLTRFPR